MMNVPAELRAGTPLTEDQRKRENLTFEDDRKGTTQHGTVDLVNRMYQIGGQFSDFHFRKLDVITMPFGIWEQLTGKWAPYLNFIEWYDREQNQAFLVSFDDAVRHGLAYRAGIGKRWGVPFQYFVRVQERLA